MLALLVTSSVARADDSPYDFDLYDLSDRLVRLEPLRQQAKLLVVDFFSTTCKPCKKALPRWTKLYRRFGKTGLRVIIVAVPDGSSSRAESRTALERYFKAHPVPFPVVFDKYSLIAKRYKVARAGSFTLPQAFLLDAQGKLIRRGTKPANLLPMMARYIR
ncbi:MAG: TlpA family protein disulfide reductase [Myxococcales bacterium]|nr:TlpA family protein disulfide reductase [Myxococcales bacterium]